MTEPEEIVECSLCHKSVPRSETCSTLACRACHKSLTLEECVNGTDPESLQLKKIKADALKKAGIE